ncbi:MAG TPA: molybdate ABC transporter permease subunit [Alphaproteobacteria bacterium]|nr:molybdate ABC transporter permease subunit [Alphaproteobacteria bacterium]
MDWSALTLSLQLGIWTILLLLPIAVIAARVLAYHRFPGRGLVEAALLLPLVLPPTVIGYYLLTAFGGASPVGVLWERAFGTPLVFSFSGLVAASVLINLPFAVQPMQRGFEAIPRDVLDAAACCGMSRWRIFTTIEAPLAWPGIVTGLVLSFAHTLGEFGVVLMVGGSIPGQTRTISIAIYDRVQAFDERAAGLMAATLLCLAVAALGLTYALSRRLDRKHG